MVCMRVVALGALNVYSANHNDTSTLSAAELFVIIFDSFLFGSNEEAYLL